MLNVEIANPLKLQRNYIFQNVEIVATLKLSHFAEIKNVEIANLSKLSSIFFRARCARPLKLCNVEIVIVSENDKRRNCWPVEIVMNSQFPKRRNCKPIEIVSVIRTLKISSAVFIFALEILINSRWNLKNRLRRAITCNSLCGFVPLFTHKNAPL